MHKRGCSAEIERFSKCPLKAASATCRKDDGLEKSLRWSPMSNYPVLHKIAAEVEEKMKIMLDTAK